MESNTITVDGMRLRWEEYGIGPPVVFLHGIPTGPRLWRHVVSCIHGFRCLAWEMVGYGWSIEEGKDRDISVARQADILIKWMDRIGLQDAVLVGHDLGGGVAQIAAVRHPERVRALVLTNSICYEAWPVPSVKLLRALGPVLDRSPRATVYLIMAILSFRGHDNRGGARESLGIHWPPYAQVDAPRALVRQVRSLDMRDTLEIADHLPRLDIPAALVWGAADRFLKIHLGERLARDLRAPIDRISGAKHFVPEDHPRRVAAAIEHVVGRLPTSI